MWRFVWGGGVGKRGGDLDVSPKLIKHRKRHIGSMRISITKIYIKSVHTKCHIFTCTCPGDIALALQKRAIQFLIPVRWSCTKMNKKN